MIEYETGATRSAEKTFDPEGFLNPEALAKFCRYMERHRHQADGKLRASDNWQRGMPTDRAYRSLMRHVFDAWLMHRGYPPESSDCSNEEDAVCGIVFNALLILKNMEDKQCEAVTLRDQCEDIHKETSPPSTLRKHVSGRLAGMSLTRPDLTKRQVGQLRMEKVKREDAQSF
jgi:hypothetical protein